MSLIKDTTTLSYLQMVGNDICTIFSDVKKKFVNLNVYYKASDFINHGLERVNFRSPFKDLLDKLVACFGEYNQIFVRIFFNQMKFSSDFITFNYFHDVYDVKSVRTLERTLMNIYCLHLKLLTKNVNNILKTESVNNFFNCLVNGKIKYNKNQIDV